MATDARFTFPYVNAGEVIALGAALPAVCILVVGLRFYTRRIQGRGYNVDDWLALAALFPTVGLGVCLITVSSAHAQRILNIGLMPRSGACMKNMGYPTPAPPSDLTPDELESYVDPTTRDNEIIQFPFQILLMLAYGLIKLSIIFFYRRLFVATRWSTTDIILITAAVVIVLWTFTFEMLIIFACGTHFWANWAAASSQLLYCSTVGFSSEYGLATSDLITDIIIFLMPVPMVWRLTMHVKRKLAVVGIFLLGASAVGASICRLIVYVQVVGASTSGAPLDTNLALTLGYFWSTLEAGLALIAACLPSFAYLVTHVRESTNFSQSGLSITSLRRILHPGRSQSTANDSQNEYESSEHVKGGAIQQLRIERSVVTDIEHYDLGDDVKGGVPPARPSEW